jgi:hypothetical protein
MRILKLTFTTLLFSSLLMLSSCTKEQGCKDGNAVNFDSEAEEDDGSCTYEGQVVMWYGEAVAGSLVENEITSLTYYVDGQIVGSSAASIFWTSAPTCEQNSSITVSKDLGNSSNLSYTYSVESDAGEVIWEGIANFTANTCTSLELAL